MVKYMSINFDSIKDTTHKREPLMDLKKELDTIIEKTRKLVIGLPDKGYFNNFGVNLPKGTKTNFFGRDISLFIERDEKRDGKAFLGISVLHPKKDIDASVYILNGDKKEILEYMNKDNFNEELQKAIERLSNSLKDVR